MSSKSLALTSLMLAFVPLAASVQGSPLRGSPGCLADGSGYFRARIRGAMSLDLDWHNAELECAGGARPDEGGIRVSFAGPLPGPGRRLRIVFGIAKTREGENGHALPTNLTVIVEGAQRLFSTRGDDKCTVDSLRQEPLGAAYAPVRTYRVVGRGFCTEPASGITRNERIVVTRFDFAGRIAFEQTLRSPK
ncbi:MAG TPA: hypothetical protein VMD03_08010 [Steroidobacteraceae bacterium]|nr:hypothetical protein [Steroidobacteraceae bacterium]